jgi:biopolymer transport protein TolR
MRRSYQYRKLERHSRRPAELLLVPMIDIFTVLVTFLLMTAVFSRTVVLQLNLPASQTDFKEPPPGLQLEVMVRKDQLVIADRNTGPLHSVANTDKGYDWDGLTQYLKFVKAKFPDKTDASVLLEPDTPYDTLVQVMDHVRVFETGEGANIMQAELPGSRAGTYRSAWHSPGPLASAGGALMSISNRALRMAQHHVRNRADAQLNLIPLIDILSVMVAFLLVYSTEVEVIQNSKGIEIPQSIAQTAPKQSVVVMITKSDLFVQGEFITTVADIRAAPGPLVEPLRAALKRPLLVGKEMTEKDLAQREITVMADKALPYDVLKRVMATCTDADYGRISLAVIQKEKPLAAGQLHPG